MRFLKFFPIYILVCMFLCGYKFPEKLPMPSDIDIFTFEKIKFGQTSINEFAYIVPNYDKPEIEGVYTIYKEIDLDKTYKSLRLGFKDQFLDWIELEFAVPLSMNKFKQLYGVPKNINDKYSKKFNYQDYGYFNLVTDKNNVSVFGITLYDESDFKQSIANVAEKLPDYKSFNFINEFIPGQLIESDFNQRFSDFSAEATTINSIKKTYTVPAKYLKRNPNYAKADLIFTNGILSFVNLIPKKLNINEVKNIYGEPMKKQNFSSVLICADYFNFSVVYNKETNNVISVGIVGAN